MRGRGPLLLHFEEEQTGVDRRRLAPGLKLKVPNSQPASAAEAATEMQAGGSTAAASVETSQMLLAH